MKCLDRRQIVGWTAVACPIAITCFWALWGNVDNLQEDLYYEYLPSIMGLVFIQYLSPTLIFLGVTVLSICWAGFGTVRHGILAMLVA
jgi:hypothetical protein